MFSSLYSFCFNYLQNQTLNRELFENKSTCKKNEIIEYEIIGKN